MLLTDTSKGVGVFLFDTYLIYIGEDNKNFPVLNTLKAQRVFNRTLFISNDPIVEDDVFTSIQENCDVSTLVDGKKYILIFADLAHVEYFFELMKVCKKLDHRSNDIVVVIVNDLNLMTSTLCETYGKFIDSTQTVHLIPDAKDIIIPKSFQNVLFNLPLDHDIPTLRAFLDELETQCFLKENQRLASD